MENFLRVLTGMYVFSPLHNQISIMVMCYAGRLDSSVPRSKRLLSDDRSNILVYMTGEERAVVSCEGRDSLEQWCV